MMKKLLIIMLVLTNVFFTSCAGKTTGSNDAGKMKIFTIEELKKYNGQNGNPAYIAIEGLVYDISRLTAWKDGEHHGYKAGNDLTKEFESASPHSVKILEDLPVVGKLSADAKK